MVLGNVYFYGRNGGGEKDKEAEAVEVPAAGDVESVGANA